MKFTSAEAIYDKAGGKRNGLPTWCYNSPELTRLEMEKIFLRHWIWLGHVCDLPNAGDYRCFDMADERALVVRGKDGKIRAFHNLCRHRAARVAVGDDGNCGNALICPFHGWTYHLDGSVKSIPRVESFPNLDKQELGLKPIDCEVWQGLIFVRFGGDGPSVANSFAAAEQEIDHYRIAEMQAYDQPWRLDFNLDWKSVVDIDSEGYHLPRGHPELFDLVGSTYSDQVLENGLNRASGSFAGRKPKTALIQNYVNALPEDSCLPESQRQQWIYWGLFPGLVITLFPDMVEVYQVYPLDYHRSVMAGSCYALADERESMRQARAYNREINTSVGEEDVQLVKWAAEGMRSSGFDEIILSDLELGVAAFHNRLRELLPVTRLDTMPTDTGLSEQNQRMLEDDKLTSAA